MAIRGDNMPKQEKKKLNPMCLRCRKRCKQNVDVKIIVCKSYTPIDG
jgi:hypothetical protein